MYEIYVISRENIDRISEKSLKMDVNRELDTDGKTTYAILKDKIKLKSEKINYKEQNHRFTGKQLMNKISKNIFLSSTNPNKSIVTTLNSGEVISHRYESDGQLELFILN